MLAFFIAYTLRDPASSSAVTPQRTMHKTRTNASNLIAKIIKIKLAM
jgi:hypothetical protein